MKFFRALKDLFLRLFQKENPPAEIQRVIPAKCVIQPTPLPDLNLATLHEVLQSKGLKMIRPVGKGSYGEVWIAQNMGTKRYLALKIVQPSKEDPTGYTKELKAVEQYRAHDLNTCSVLKVSAPIDLTPIAAFAYTMPLADDANGCFSTEGGDANRYETKSLSWKLKRSGALSTEECIEIAQNVINGLELLHKKRLIHRDIKPANILFFDGHAVLADIGLITTPSHEVSQCGTLGYIPYEGVGRERADIFAIGKLLYEMATGLPCPPNADLQFPAHESDSTMRRLHRVIMMTCEQNERKRYINSHALSAALRRVTEKDPHIPDEESTSRWIKLKEEERINNHMSDPRALNNFKLQIHKQIKESTKKMKNDMSVTKLEPTHFFSVTNELLKEFETRLGFDPVQAIAVCNLAQSIIAGKRDRMNTRWVPKIAQEIVRGRREHKAFDTLRHGIDLVIDELWEKDFAQLEAS